MEQSLGKLASKFNPGKKHPDESGQVVFGSKAMDCQTLVRPKYKMF